jgi:calcineurin-like phosphoesterase family protein
VIFFTGCTHFGHENIIRLANRPFADADEMDSELIRRWNARVGEEDEVYHLGDFAWKVDQSRLRTIMNSLNGRIHLIHGNHDREVITMSRRFAISTKYLIERRPGMEDMVMFHYPIEEWQGFFHGAWHVHAHTHKSEKRGTVGIERRVNVTVEAWDYAPASLDEVYDVWRKA